MGIVYKARHRNLRRMVALKMLRGAALADPEFRDRFQAEAEAVARLQHPNIIQVFEIGSVECFAGEQCSSPFISLELVEGGSLVRCTDRPQPPRYAAEMVEKLARAVHFAHRLGVVHRDIKPANVLLTPEGEPKIADFGLAKQIGSECDERGRFLTQAGTIVGTPEYMAPEQAASKAPTPAVDIYALGVILYEMVTGRVPFHAATPVETMHLMLHEEPVSPRQLQPSLPWDLETICLKCLEKDPNRRYATAGELADDLRSFLDDRPIRARRLNGYERLIRWCRRNPLGAGIIGTFLIAFTLVLFSYWRADAAWLEEAKQRREAQRKEKAERWERYRAYIAAAASSLQVYNAESASRNLEKTPDEYRNWEWRHFQSRLDLSQHVLRAGEVEVTGAAIFGHGDRAALFGENGFVRIWDTTTCKEVRTIRSPAEATGGAQSIDGRLFAYQLKDHSIAIRDVEADRTICILRGHTESPHTIQFADDSKRLFTASIDGTARVWDLASGTAIQIMRPFTKFVGAARMSPDGHRAVISDDRSIDVRLVDLDTGKEIATLPGHDCILQGICFNAAGDRFVTGDGFNNNELKLWDSKTGKLIAVLGRHNNLVTEISFNRDGTRFASGSMDQTARLWDGVTGKPIATLKGHYGRVGCLSFSPDGKKLVTGSQDHTARLWDAATGEPLGVLSGHTAWVTHVAFTTDGSRIVTTSSDRTVRIWDAQTVENYGILRGHTSFVYSVAFLPDGERAASAGWDGTVRIWDLATGKQKSVFDHGAEKIVTSVAVHPSGRMLASRTRGSVRLWDIESGRELCLWKVPAGGWKDSRLAFSPKGDLLVTGCQGGLVRIWDVETRKEVATLKAHRDEVRDVAFSPDGKWLATAGEIGDKTIRIWNVATMETVHVLKGHTECVYGLAFNREGNLLASCGMDGTARLWDTNSWTQVGVMKHGIDVFGVAFTPDQSRLACACADNSIRLWDVATQQSVAELRGHTDYVHQIAFSPDGTKLVSASGDFTLRVWDTVRPQDRDGGQ